MSCVPVGPKGSTMALLPKEGLKASTAEVGNVLCTGVRQKALQAEDVWYTCGSTSTADWAEPKQKYLVHLHKMQQ